MSWIQMSEPLTFNQCIQQEFSIDIDLRQMWTDESLRFNSSDPDMPIYIYHNVDKFWLPDIYFPNEKSSRTYSVQEPNRVIRIYSNGTVRYVTR